MTPLPQYGPWIDNTGVPPEVENGRGIEIEYNLQRIQREYKWPISLVWDLGTASGNIKKYRLEILPEQFPVPEIEESLGEWGPRIGWSGGLRPVEIGEEVRVWRDGSVLSGPRSINRLSDCLYWPLHHQPRLTPPQRKQ